MNLQIDEAGGKIHMDGFKERMYRIKMPETLPPIAPRIRKSASAQLAVQRAEAWRHERIATAAYYIAEKRGFEPGHEDEDWRLAEAQIDAIESAI
jgi:Protein of unknown function (DUF2934)